MLPKFGKLWYIMIYFTMSFLQIADLKNFTCCKVIIQIKKVSPFLISVKLPSRPDAFVDSRFKKVSLSFILPSKRNNSFTLDVDECTTGTQNCDGTRATCTNTAGSFTCACNSGYSGAGTTGTCTRMLNFQHMLQFNIYS